MKQRLLNILYALVKGGCISRFAEDGESNFEVFTEYSVFDMMTWLKFEITGDVMRVRFTHLLGTLDVDDGVNPQDLIKSSWLIGILTIGRRVISRSTYWKNSSMCILKTRTSIF